MIQLNIRVHARRLAMAVLLTLSIASVACASTWSPRETPPPRDVMKWTTVSCASCAQHGLEVAVRNSLDAKGKPGRHMAARIRNLNPHAVALVLEIVPEQSRPMDEALVSQKWQVMLHPAGDDRASSMVMLNARDLQAVAVHDVEKF